jgi:hypothetical protein
MLADARTADATLHHTVRECNVLIGRRGQMIVGSVSVVARC